MKRFKVNFFTTYHIQCGIADYSEYLINYLKEFVNIEIIELEKNKIGNKKYFSKLGERMNKGDIAHIQFENTFFNGILPSKTTYFNLVKKIQIPIVITAHEIDVYSKSKNLFIKSIIKFLKQHLNRIIFGKGKFIIVHSIKQKQILINLGIENKKILYLPHPIPLHLYRQVDKSISKKKLGVENKTVLTIFGFISKGKGYDILLNALSNLPENTILLIIGNKSPYELEYFYEFKDKIDKKNLNNRVIITGYIEKEKLAEYISASDIYLAPFSKISGSGSLALSIAFKLPIIASDIDEHKEIEKRGAGIEIFKAGNSLNLIEKILLLITNEERKKNLIEKNIEYGEQYSYQKISQEIYKIYMNIER